MPTLEELRKKKQGEQPERTLDYLRGVKAGMEKSAAAEEPAGQEPRASGGASIAYDPRFRGVLGTDDKLLETPEGRKKARDDLVTAMSALAGPLAPGGLLARVGLMAGIGAGSSVAGEALDPSSSIGEAAGRAAKSGGFNAATELGGGLVAKGLGKLAGGLFRPTPAGAAAAKAIEAEGGVLTPALQSESRPAKLLESLAESSLLGSKTIAETRAAATQAALKPVERFVEGMRSGFSREELGSIAQEALEGKAEAFKAAASVAYGEVDKVLAATPAAAGQPAIGVSLRGLKAAAEGMLKRGLGTSNATKQLNAVLALPDEVSFQKAAEIRSDLLSPAAEAGEILVGTAKGQVKRLVSLADQAMNESFATASVGRRAQGEALRLWREANELYKEGAQLFNAKMVKALASKQPEAVVSAITQAQKPGTIRTLKAAIGDDRVWRGIQGEFLSDLMAQSTVNSGDQARATIVSGQIIATKLQKFGEPALRELLGTENAAAFKNMIKILERSQQRTGSGLSGLNARAGIEIAAGSSGLTMLASGNIYGLVPMTITLTPAVIGKLFTNPRTVRIITQGLYAPAGSPEAVRAMADVMRAIGQVSVPLAAGAEQSERAR